MTTGALRERAHPYLNAAALAARSAYVWLRNSRGQLALIGSIALVASVVALIAYLFSAPETAPSRVMAWVTGTLTSLLAAALALGFLVVAGALIAIGAGFPPSKWNIKGRFDTVREYLTR